MIDVARMKDVIVKAISGLLMADSWQICFPVEVVSISKTTNSYFMVSL